MKLEANGIGWRFFLSLLMGAVTFSVAAKPPAGRVIGWNYTGAVANDLPANLTNIVAISSAAGGNYYSQNLALRSDGTVIAWGKNSLGQLRTNVPIQVKDVVAIAAGGDHYLALKKDATVFAWQTGTLLSVPAAITNVAAITAGRGGYSLALTKSGQVLSWTYGAVNHAVPVTLASNVMAIAGGNAFFIAVKTNGTAVAWGVSNLGQTNIPAWATNLIACAVDAIHTIGLKADGSVIAWGATWGDGQTNVPSGLTNVIAVAAGGIKGSHNVVLKSDGTVVTWGASQVNIPAEVTNVVAIAAGDYYNLAIIADSTRPNMQFTGGRPVIRFHTFSGRQYSVEYSAGFASGNWMPLLPVSLPGTGREIIITDTNNLPDIRFYRIKEW